MNHSGLINIFYGLTSRQKAIRTATLDSVPPIVSDLK